jgi:YHS domain-containing protein
MMIGCLILAAGCAADPVATGAERHEECLPCKARADLGCVDVIVDEKTPHTVYLGRTYYFCSEDCKREFLKQPAKFAQK